MNFMPHERATVLLDDACPICREPLAGKTTATMAKIGLTFHEIFAPLPPVKSRAWGGLIVKLVHRNHLN